MRVITVLCVLAIAITSPGEARPSASDAGPELQRSERAAAPGRRFRTAPLKKNRKYFESMLGLRVTPDEPRRYLPFTFFNKLHTVYSKVVPPKSFSWLDKPNIVTSIKNQVGCGSCYAFAADAALESMLAIWEGKKSLDLSEQHIVDCSQAQGNNGCNGGSIDRALRFIAAAKGVHQERAYPYVEVAGQCRTLQGQTYGAGIESLQMQSQQEDTLKKVLYLFGPVAIGVRSNVTSFFEYVGGIYDDPECNTGKGPDHAVVLVGYGEENGVQYWMIKNSWGPNWGERGYMRILRGKHQCKIGHIAVLPLLPDVANSIESGKAIQHKYY